MRKLKQLRKCAGLSQEELAALTGLDQSFISRLEGGKTDIALSNIYKIAQALHVEPAELLSEAKYQDADDQPLKGEPDRLTHFDEAGAARMVDVSEKPVTARTAVARGAVRMAAATLAHVTEGTAKKGDVLAVARLAGIMGAKRTAELVPLCHPLALTKVALELKPDPASSRVLIEATVKTSGQTGVEMEALTAVTVAALTVYDMLKAVDRAMVIEDVRLALKEGGKSGRYEAP